MSARYIFRSCSGFRFLCSSSLSENTINARNLKESLGAKLFRNPLDASIVIAKWKEEGHAVDRREIEHAIHGLINHKRRHDALIIWDSLVEQKFVEPTRQDYASHMGLIANHRGLHSAEKYFEGIPDGIRGEFIHSALLKIYVQRAETAKAEALMEKMAEGGLLTSEHSYIHMMSLYMSIGKNDKAEEMSKEVKKHIVPDVRAYNMWLNAYASMNNVEGADIVFSRMKEANVEPSWLTHGMLAGLYIKNKLFEKAASALKEMEKLVWTGNRKHAYCSLIRMHGSLGNKDGVLRVWERMKLKCKINGYLYSMMVSTLLKVDSYEKAEEIFSEWTELLKCDIVPEMHSRALDSLKKAKAGKQLLTVEEDKVENCEQKAIESAMEVGEESNVDS